MVSLRLFLGESSPFFFIQDMVNTVVIKLLGRSIGFAVLQNKIYNSWKPSMLIKMMDIGNGYFFVRFQSKENYERVFSQGPWIIFGQYLMVQLWSLESNPAWIRFQGFRGICTNERYYGRLETWWEKWQN